MNFVHFIWYQSQLLAHRGLNLQTISALKLSKTDSVQQSFLCAYHCCTIHCCKSWVAHCTAAIILNHYPSVLMQLQIHAVWSLYNVLLANLFFSMPQFHTSFRKVCVFCTSVIIICFTISDSVLNNIHSYHTLKSHAPQFF